MESILFITTHNLASNPRLVKEIRLALHQGFTVEVICFRFNNWSKGLNDVLVNELQQLGVMLHQINAGREDKLTWLRAVCREQCCRVLARIFPNGSILANAVSRRSAQLVTHLNLVNKQPTWVVGHNPGAMMATSVAAKRFKCMAGFDVEDYHPGEGHNHYLQALVLKLMKSQLPSFHYVSFASPLIMEEVVHQTSFRPIQCFTVLNYFSAGEFSAPQHITGPVKLVWFSQNINFGRGLELVIPFVHASANVELHLYGNMDPVFFETHLRNIRHIQVHAPVPQAQLHSKLAEYDIGLALEPAKDRNNELAISNKILAYMQAGLFVVATNTPAQQQFLHQWQDHGVSTGYSANQLAQCLADVLANISTIRNKRQWRYNHFMNQNWETESLALLNAWRCATS